MAESHDGLILQTGESSRIPTPKPDSDGHRDSLFDDSLVHPGSLRASLNPDFLPSSAHPKQPRAVTSSAAISSNNLLHRNFHSRRVKRGQVEKPWIQQIDPREIWVTIIPLIGLFIGCCIAGFLVWDGLRAVVNHEYCLVLDENFSSGEIDTAVWLLEQEVGGYGNGQFDQTTNQTENAFIRDQTLILKPTLQDPALLTEYSAIDLLATDLCTSTDRSACIVVTNLTNGSTIPPTRSARLSTRDSHSIRFGRIEVTAQLPRGDWLWPAIWLLPLAATYGPWPRSGEIDIAESRGNNHSYSLGGVNTVSSALHWGPDADHDAWWRTHVQRKALHTTYAARHHTFGLEWSEKYLFTYLDSRLQQVLYVDFDRPWWARGVFPVSDRNGSRLVDPWSQTGNAATPFDQAFYLVLNVAVGGTNGWFEDGKSGKPWVDASPRAKRDFWEARDSWLPTWEDGGREMRVKSVKMWQQKGYGSCL